MRKMMLIALTVLSIVLTGWRTDFDKAKMDAKKEHKLILLKFSGSDWCLPCIKMESDIFANDSFGRFAAANLEMVIADFPRMKKHKLGSGLEMQNDTLAQKYNRDGRFPYTLLLDADGNILRVWDGYKGEKPETIIQQIRPYAGTN